MVRDALERLTRHTPSIPLPWISLRPAHSPDVRQEDPFSGMRGRNLEPFPSAVTAPMSRPCASTAALAAGIAQRGNPCAGSTQAPLAMVLADPTQRGEGPVSRSKAKKGKPRSRAGPGMPS